MMWAAGKVLAQALLWGLLPLTWGYSAPANSNKEQEGECLKPDANDDLDLTNRAQVSLDASGSSTEAGVAEALLLQTWELDGEEAKERGGEKTSAPTLDDLKQLGCMVPELMENPEVDNSKSSSPLKTKEKLWHCNLTLAEVQKLCVPEARFNPGLKDLYKKAIQNWKDCFGYSFNVYLIIMDEIMTDFGKTGGATLGADKIGAWGATEGLIAMMKDLKVGSHYATDILKGWRDEEVIVELKPGDKYASDVEIPQEFKRDGKNVTINASDFEDFWKSQSVAQVGEFPFMYMHAVMRGLEGLGFTGDEIKNLTIQYDGIRIKQKVVDAYKKYATNGGVCLRSPAIANEAIQYHMVSAFTNDNLGYHEPVVGVITSGSRYDAWDGKCPGSNAIAEVMKGVDTVAENMARGIGRNSICYGHQAFAEHHGNISTKGKVAMHTWEIGARPTEVDKTALNNQSYFGNSTNQLTLSYVHFDEVVKPGFTNNETGKRFLGNPHTPIEGITYRQAITTQGHPEVPFVYDIAMIASCTLWPVYYSNDTDKKPSAYCVSMFEKCDKSFAYGKDQKCDGEAAKGTHAGYENEVVATTGTGDGVAVDENEANKDAEDFEKGCTQCLMNVQLGQVRFLLHRLDHDGECAVGDLGKRISKAFPGQNFADVNDIETKLKSLMLEKAGFDVTNKTGGGDAGKTVYQDKGLTESSKYKDFDDLNAMLWYIVLELQRQDLACFNAVLADILPDAKKVAELWVRNMVTSHLRSGKDNLTSGKDNAQ